MTVSGSGKVAEMLLARLDTSGPSGQLGLQKEYDATVPAMKPRNLKAVETEG
jgi:hypothetical protein